uniref:Uncharacterized protein n=1 Tax=Arundo donax TaxID=35708 RepID=A0A0A8Y5Q6_ARUDO
MGCTHQHDEKCCYTLSSLCSTIELKVPWWRWQRDMESVGKKGQEV